MLKMIIDEESAKRGDLHWTQYLPDIALSGLVMATS